nr:hypothetical protein [Bacteroidota bacterium]
MFGVPWPKSEYEEPEASFRFWVEANKRVLKKGEILGKKHFLWVSFDALCTNRKNEVKKIIKFLGIKPGRKTLKKAVTLPEIPSSTGRFRNYDISGFGKDDLDFLISLGYSIT